MQFALDENSWRCTTCRVKNPNTAFACRSCEAVSPTATPEQIAQSKAAAEAKRKAEAAAAAATAKPSGFTMSSTGFAFGGATTGAAGTGFAFGAKPAAPAADGAASPAAAPVIGGFKFTPTAAPAAAAAAPAAAPSAAPAAAAAAAAAPAHAAAPATGASRGKTAAPVAASAVAAPAAKRAAAAPVTAVNDNGAAAKACVAANAAAVKPNAAIAKKKGLVFSFGAGDMSQLGLGRQTRERKFPALIKTLEEEDVVAVAAGALHNLVLTKTGKVYSWGCNDDGAIGRETATDVGEMAPALVDGLAGVTVTQISCGASHSLALDDKGTVYSWGAYRDASGLVGYNTDSMRQNAAAAIEFPHVSGRAVVIAQVVAGESHSLALDTEGRVWYWGDVFIGRRQNDRHKRARLSPRLVNFPPKPRKGSKAAREANMEDWDIKSVCAGGYSSFAIAASGNVWVWGPNNYSQCGIQRPSEDEHGMSIVVPTIIPFFAENKIRVKAAASAAQFSVILTEDSRVFTFGRTADGRLGHGDFDYGAKAFEITTPKEVSGLNPVYLSSDASWSQPAPHVTTEMNPKVTTKTADRVVAIAVAEAHALAYTSAGRAFGWGSGDLGQLGYGEETVCAEPYWIRSMQLTTVPRRVVGVAAGAQHSLILAKDFE